MLTHICAADEWHVAEALGAHRPGSLEAVGFVHLSAPEQVHLPANRLYRGRTDLLLLQVDPDRLTAPVSQIRRLPSSRTAASRSLRPK